jgi:hypothetical protein
MDAKADSTVTAPAAGGAGGDKPERKERIERGPPGSRTLSVAAQR